jgi:hypothetical protein
VKRVVISVLNGEWFQVYGEGCDGSLLKRHSTCFSDLDNPLPKQTAETVCSDGSTARSLLLSMVDQI